MTHSKNFEKIKKYYEKQLWSLRMVYNVVGKKTGITKEQFQEITGIPYDSIDPE